VETNGLPYLAGRLGMVPRRADHRCQHVQELQLRGGKLDDVHDGLHALQHPGIAHQPAALARCALDRRYFCGPSVTVGRGSQFFLRNRKDVFHVFLYASRDHKIRRLISRGESQDRAIELIDTTDKARAAFVQQYLELKWPEPHLYHAMFNTEMGESSTTAMLLQCVKEFESDR
jgi:Cytidylate kinase-like family